MLDFLKKAGAKAGRIVKEGAKDVGHVLMSPTPDVGKYMPDIPKFTADLAVQALRGTARVLPTIGASAVDQGKKQGTGAINKTVSQLQELDYDARKKAISDNEGLRTVLKNKGFNTDDPNDKELTKLKGSNKEEAEKKTTFTPGDRASKILLGKEPVESYQERTKGNQEAIENAPDAFSGVKPLAGPLSFLGAGLTIGGDVTGVGGGKGAAVKDIGEQLAKETTEVGVKKLLKNVPKVVQDKIAPLLAKTTDAQQAREIVRNAASDFKDPIKRAATALTGDAPETLVQNLNKQVANVVPEVTNYSDITKALEKSTQVKSEAAKLPGFEKLRDTQGVLASHFGEVGSTAGYKLQQGAKTVSDIQEAVGPEVQRNQKLLKKISKTSVGKADVQERISQALEDRANVDQYLRTPQEKELYESTSKILDFFKDQRVQRGKGVISENYSPRTQVRDALDAPDRLLTNVKTAFSTDVGSTFSKTRTKELPDEDINKRIVELIPHYVNSQSKEFGYEDAINYVKENMSKVNPAYTADGASKKRGEKYFQTLMSQILSPEQATKGERFQNKAIGQTYKSQLGFSPKFAAQNITQRYATKARTSKQASKVASKVDDAVHDELEKGIVTGFNPIMGEIEQGNMSVGGKASKFRKLDPGQKVEEGNVKGAFRKGSMQAVIDSEPYKAAVKSGMKPKDAVVEALKIPEVKERAIRAGNVVVNTTQFGGNFAAKPEFLRKGGSIALGPLPISRKWYQQYQRFPAGMSQIIASTVKTKDARMLDILRRGDPLQTPIVDYHKAAQALTSGVDDLIKGIKKGEVADVSLDNAKQYQKLLTEATKTLEKQMKGVSQVKRGKTIKNVAKMWAAASAIQFLFDGGPNSDTAKKDGTGAEVTKSIKYGAPVNVPTKDQNPLAGARIPSSPFDAHGINKRKLLNFIPIVGPVVNRGNDVKRLIGALTGDN